MASEDRKYGYTIPQWVRATGVGRTRVYAFMKTGDLDFVKIGSRTIIVTDPVEFLQRFLPGGA